MSLSIAQKLIAVFGSGQTIDATITDTKITFTDGATQLAFDHTDETRQPPGNYKATFGEAPATEPEDGEERPVTYSLSLVFVSELPEVGKTASGKNPKPGAKQSPMERFDAPSRPVR